jgi:predicted nucleotidyltransferase
MESSVPLNRAAEFYIEMIKDVVLAGLSSEDVSIALFGSMANNKAHRSSDVDVAVLPRDGWNRSKMVLLRERLENLNVPYNVDLVDFSSVSGTFREIALRTAIWWRR